MGYRWRAPSRAADASIRAACAAHASDLGLEDDEALGLRKWSARPIAPVTPLGHAVARRNCETERRNDDGRNNRLRRCRNTGRTDRRRARTCARRTAWPAART